MSDQMIRRIQALLAKAESTTHQAEADVFFAKAEELMLKHAVEAWQLAKDEGRSVEIIKERFGYTSNDWSMPGKRQVAGAAAKLAGVNVVFHNEGSHHTQYLTVIGAESDVAFYKLLQTSLMVQAMGAATRNIKASKRELSSYLVGYAAAVRQRATVATPAGGSSTALVLVDRKNEVDAATARYFPTTRQMQRYRPTGQAYFQGHAAGLNADTSGGRNM